VTDRATHLSPSVSPGVSHTRGWGQADRFGLKSSKGARAEKPMRLTESSRGQIVRIRLEGLTGLGTEV
jgi:hypothetical protein